MPADQPTAAESTPARPMRRDARRNRDALLGAARECFAERGLEAPLEQVAKQAGLAIGTLYRHFPTRLDLVQAVFAEKLAAWLSAAEEAAAMDDAWGGLRLFLETMCELQAADQGFNDLASMQLPAAACLAGTQNRIHELGVLLVRRAQEQGAMRADLEPEDLAFVIWSHARITEATQGIAPRAWRRHLYLMLDAFRAERAHPLPEPPLSSGQLARAMDRLGTGGVCSGS
ncbi:TetR/AcrR family transcriptional regulator [Streptomyces sp. NPDC021212]|uniref:TetR/AcrR family transcriptional regulator n=1 Tax=Streptomyces sp. NPDC021212 TaxID=3365118 RepID=UPI0037BC08BD